MVITGTDTTITIMATVITDIKVTITDTVIATLGEDPYIPASPTAIITATATIWAPSKPLPGQLSQETGCTTSAMALRLVLPSLRVSMAVSQLLWLCSVTSYPMNWVSIYRLLSVFCLQSLRVTVCCSLCVTHRLAAGSLVVALRGVVMINALRNTRWEKSIEFEIIYEWQIDFEKIVIAPPQDLSRGFILHLVCNFVEVWFWEPLEIILASSLRFEAHRILFVFFDGLLRFVILI